MNVASDTKSTRGLPGLVSRRKALGWTQEKLAAKVGLHRVTVANYEIGIQDPGLAKVRDLASALGCTPADLLTHPSDDTTTCGSAGRSEEEIDAG